MLHARAQFGKRSSHDEFWIKLDSAPADRVGSGNGKPQPDKGVFVVWLKDQIYSLSGVAKVVRNVTWIFERDAALPTSDHVRLARAAAVDGYNEPNGNRHD